MFEVLLAFCVRAGMEDYLKAVTTKPGLETIFLHEQDQGMGVTLKKL